jgi:serine/threonine protein kinase
VYAFGCLIFEAYTGRPLFDAVNEAELLGEHMAHDGDPEAVRALLGQPETRDLGALIARCLRRDPKDRITIRQARQFLAELNLGAEDVDWPVRIAS